MGTESPLWSPEPPIRLPRDLERPWACGGLSAQLQEQNQAPVQLLPLGQPYGAAMWASTVWIDRPDYLGIGPLPVPGQGPAIPLYQPRYESAAWGWDITFFSGAGGVLSR